MYQLEFVRKTVEAFGYAYFTTSFDFNKLEIIHPIESAFTYLEVLTPMQKYA